MQRHSSANSNPSEPGNAGLPASPSVRHGSRWPAVYPLARALFLFAILAFVAHVLWRNWGELREHEFSLKWQPIALSYTVFGGYLVSRGLIWHWMTHKFGCAIPLRQALAAWFYSLLGKYVPGKVFLLAGRLHFYRREGRSSPRVSICFGVEALCDILGAVLLLLLAPLFADLPLLAQYRAAALVVVVVFLIVIRPRHLELLANPLLKLAHQPPISLPVRYRDILAVVTVFTLNWALLGLAFFLFTSALYPMESPYLFYLAGSFALACTIGILAVFAPAGLGVREGVLVVALSAIMPHGIAIVVTLASRLWMTVGELVTVGVVALVSQAEWREIHQGGRNADIGASKPESSPGGPSAMV